jgi:hypothetical protein
MTHVRLVGVDVELLTRVLLDDRTDLDVELDFLPQSGRVGVGVPGFCEVLRDGRERTHDHCHGLVERNPKRLGFVQRVRVGGVTAEVMKVLPRAAKT